MVLAKHSTKLLVQYLTRARRQLYSTVHDVDDAKVLIIGGGAVGTSIAYHLAKRGVERVLLVEQLELTAGSTWHAAGLTTNYHPGVNIKNLHYDSLQLYSKLPEETGQDVGLHAVGTIRVATTPTRMDEFRYQMARQGWHPAQQKLLTAEETLTLHPLLNPDMVLGGLYTPGDGYVDPYSLTQALAIGARNNGARITFAKVTATTEKSDGSWTVETDKGRINAESVINVGGFWARDVAKLCGLDLPLVSVYHTYLTTSTVPEIEALKTELPVIRDLECATYYRQERQGLCVGTYEGTEFMKMQEDWYDNGVTEGFGKELFVSDIEPLQENLAQAMELLPVLKTANIRKLICGPMNYSPENLPLIGPCQGRRNYWLAVGFGYGIVHAGGVGKFVADWMVDGEAPYSLVELDPLRFGRWSDRTHTLEKVRESYVLNSKVIFPREEKPAGRPTRRVTPMYDLLKSRGAQFGFNAGWERANYFAATPEEASYLPSFRRTNWFKAVARETAAARDGVVVVDLSDTGKYEITGDDALEFCDYMYARKMPQNGEAYACHMLTPAGKVYAEHLVGQTRPGHMFCVTGGLSERHDLRWMESVLVNSKFRADISNVTDVRGCLSIFGPKSNDVMADLSSDVHSMEKSQINVVQIGDCNVIAVKSSLSGELGWELYPLTKDLPTLYNMLMESGRPYGITDLGLYAYNTLRIENGTPAWGSELKVDYNSIEAGLCGVIDSDKEANFVGKESVEKLQSTMQERSLVMLKVNSPDHDVDPEGYETVWGDDGQVVGNTTSGCYSHHLATGLAFAYLSRSCTQPGSSVRVEMLGQLCPATVLSSTPLQSLQSSEGGADEKC